MYIFVLAGGINKTNEPNSFVKKRLDKAIELHTSDTSDTSQIIVLGGGTYHKPPALDSNNYVIHESTSCSSYLIKNGVKPDKIIREWASYDTIANGYFAFTNYVIPFKINECYIITSQFHMNRTQTIFNYFNKLITNNSVNLKFIETVNIIEGSTLEIRLDRELKSNINFKTNIIDNISVLEKFSLWFYTEHNAYKSNISYYIDYLINDTY
jgi:vancomycin permeability regulator SanA